LRAHKKAPSRKIRANLKIKKREGNALNSDVKFFGALNLYMPTPYLT